MPQAYAEEAVAVITPAPTVAPVPVTSNTGSVYSIVQSVFVNRFGWGEWASAEYVVNRESGFNPYAVNSSSGACGLGQSLPCGKVLSYAGSLDNVQGQANWMADYIASRYTNPDNAAWHERNYNWY